MPLVSPSATHIHNFAKPQPLPAVLQFTWVPASSYVPVLISVPKFAERSIRAICCQTRHSYTPFRPF